MRPGPTCAVRASAQAIIDGRSRDLIQLSFRELCSDAGIKNRVSHRAHGGWGFLETERVICFRKPLMTG